MFQNLLSRICSYEAVTRFEWFERICLNRRKGGGDQAQENGVSRRNQALFWSPRGSRLFNAKPLRRGSRGQALPHAAVVEFLEVRTLLTASPIGDQFLVSEAVELADSPPSVAVIETSGNFIATWTSFAQTGQDESGQGVYAQRFDAAGMSLGDAFLVNTGFTAGDQRASDVATDALGNFVIVWESQDQDGDGAGIYAQRYNSSGTPQGDAFQLNIETEADQSRPTIAMDNDGNFVIAWQSFGQDGDGFGIYARRFEADGTPIDAGDVLVNITTAGDQTSPSAAAARTSESSPSGSTRPAPLRERNSRSIPRSPVTSRSLRSRSIRTTAASWSSGRGRTPMASGSLPKGSTPTATLSDLRLRSTHLRAGRR